MDLYYDREDLMTPEEIEEFHFDRNDAAIPTYTPKLRKWLLDEFDEFLPCPDAHDKKRFLRRKPGLGGTRKLIEEARSHHQILPPVQQRILFKSIRSKMLRQLIPCPGVDNLDGLLDILQAELDSGVPSPIPDWYEFSDVKFGPRAMGYYSCENRGCFNTDTVDKKMMVCSKCQLAFYCCRDCQVADWKQRHKQICKKGADEREKMKKCGDILSMFTMMHK